MLQWYVSELYVVVCGMNWTLHFQQELYCLYNTASTFFAAAGMLKDIDEVNSNEEMKMASKEPWSSWIENWSYKH